MTDRPEPITHVTDSEERYELRFFEPADRAGFLSLYESVFGHASGAWFDWKYANNPYADHVPVIVAANEGEIVGAKPAFALRVRVGDATHLAMQPCDTMVGADHRRRGLYAAMLDYQKDAYLADETGLFFNFPNPQSMPGSLQAGWRPVSELPTYYRIHDPTSLVGGEDDADGVDPVALGTRLAAPLFGAYRRVRNRTLPSPDDVSVTRYEEVPSEVFASLYDEHVPDRIHALRDETFYDWRFENPQWTYTAYVARRDGEARAGIVTGSRTENGTTTNLLDTVPMVADRIHAGPIAALLTRIVTDHVDSDTLAIRGRTVPPSVLRSYGFRSDRAFPLSLVSSPSTLVTRPSTDEGLSSWEIEGVDLLDESNWSLSYCELDST